MSEGMTGEKLSAMGMSGAGTGHGGKGALLFNAIPHVGMQGSVFSAFMGKAPSLIKGMTGAEPGEMKIAAPTPGAAIKTDILNRQV